jgi:hypothetical protein
MLLLNHEIRLFLTFLRQSNCQKSSGLPSVCRNEQVAEIDTLSKQLIDLHYPLICGPEPFLTSAHGVNASMRDSTHDRRVFFLCSLSEERQATTGRYGDFSPKTRPTCTTCLLRFCLLGPDS